MAQGAGAGAGVGSRWRRHLPATQYAVLRCAVTSKLKFINRPKATQNSIQTPAATATAAAAAAAVQFFCAAFCQLALQGAPDDGDTQKQQ